MNGRRIQVGATRWYVREAGAGPVVVFVPGLGEGEYMVPHAQRLAGQFAVRVVDVPNFGRSRAAARPVDVTGFADLLLDYLATFPAPVSLVGSSFGCQLAVAAAVAQPQRVARLVLVSPTFDAAARTVPHQLLRWLPTMVREPPALALGLAKSYLRSGVRTPWQAFRAGLTDPIEDRIASVSAPVLIVRGGADRIVSADFAARLAGRARCAQVATIPGRAHTLDFSAPEQLAALSIPFLAGATRAAAPAG